MFKIKKVPRVQIRLVKTNVQRKAFPQNCSVVEAAAQDVSLCAQALCGFPLGDGRDDQSKAYFDAASQNIPVHYKGHFRRSFNNP